MVLRSVFQQYDTSKVISLDAEDLVGLIRKYAEALGAYFAKFTALGIAGFASVNTGPFKTEIAGEIYKALPDYTDEAGTKWIDSSILPKLKLLQEIAQWASDGHPRKIDLSASSITFSTPQLGGPGSRLKTGASKNDVSLRLPFQRQLLRQFG